MTECVNIKLPKPKICIADLNKRVQILKRAIVAPIGESVYMNTAPLESTFNFQVIATVWAAIKTIKGDAILDSVATNDLPTHWFFMRYRTNVTLDNWLLYQSEYYRVQQVMNLDEYNTILQIKTVKTGSTAKQAAQV
jgi:SPP1 family predicted phage head-tail adaptor